MASLPLAFESSRSGNHSFLERTNLNELPARNGDVPADVAFSNLRIPEIHSIYVTPQFVFNDDAEYLSHFALRNKAPVDPGKLVGLEFVEFLKSKHPKIVPDDAISAFELGEPEITFDQPSSHSPSWSSSSLHNFGSPRMTEETKNDSTWDENASLLEDHLTSNTSPENYRLSRYSIHGIGESSTSSSSNYEKNDTEDDDISIDFLQLDIQTILDADSFLSIDEFENDLRFGDFSLDPSLASNDDDDVAIDPADFIPELDDECIPETPPSAGVTSPIYDDRLPTKSGQLQTVGLDARDQYYFNIKDRGEGFSPGKFKFTHGREPIARIDDPWIAQKYHYNADFKLRSLDRLGSDETVPAESSHEIVLALAFPPIKRLDFKTGSMPDTSRSKVYFHKTVQTFRRWTLGRWRWARRYLKSCHA